MSDNIPLSVELLINELKEVTSWYVFGASLGIPISKLDTIKKECSDVEEQKIKMFQFWLQYKLDASWKKVIQVLEQNGHNVLAVTLSNKYLLSSEEKESEADHEIKSEIETAAVVERLRSLETSFADMLIDLLDLLSESKCDLSKAQFYLNHLFKTEEFSQCKDFPLLLQQLHVSKGHIDTFNIYYLKKLVDRFKVENLTKCIGEYETKMRDFLGHTTVLDFQRAVVSRVKPIKPNQTKDLTIRVSKAYAMDRTLEDMEELALRGLGDCERFLVRIHMKPGSVIISWFFPEALSDKLEHLAYENAAVFKDAGVEEVTVDGRVVFPRTLKEEASIDSSCLSYSTDVSEPSLLQSTSSLPQHLPTLGTTQSTCTTENWECLSSIRDNFPPDSHKAIDEMMLYLYDEFCRFYQELPDIPVSEWFWPKLDRTRYVTLGLVTNQNYTGDDQFTHSSLHKSADDIHSRKTEISYQATFPQIVKKVDFKILISGRPGSGKTFLLNKLSKDWTRGECFKSVPVLILVRLRELAAMPSKIKLVSIIELYFEIEETDKIVSFIESCKGEGFCFALDGLDEYPHLNKHGDFITKLIRGSCLPKAAVVVTSRPTHSHVVRDNVQRHIEIIGFLLPQIEEYIQEHYKDEPKRSNELIGYLQARPNVMSMCYLPLHLAIVIFEHKKNIESGKSFSLPETESGIYWQFLRHTVIRHAKREYQEEDTMIKEILDVDKFLSDLSDKDCQAFHTICKLAYLSKLSAILIFSSQDMREKFKLSKGNIKEVKEMGFGILSNYKKVTVDGETSVFSFQHLTIQEFLGAFHLQSLSQHERIGEIARYGSRIDMREVWKFFCGLMMMRNPIEHFVCFVQLIRQNPFGRENVLFLIKCAFESQTTTKYEKEKSDRVCHELLAFQSGKINVSNISLGTADCLAIGHVIGKSHMHLTDLLMNYCHVGPDGVKALKRQVGGSKFDSLKQMQIRSQLNPVGARDEGGHDLIELLKGMENLEVLRLYGNQLKTDQFRYLEPIISRMTDLRILVLTKNSLGPAAGECLNVILPNLPHLIQFYVSYNPLTTEGLAKLCPGLLHCSKLQRLGLRGCELDSDAGHELVKILTNLEELEQLEFYRNHLGDKGVTIIYPALCQAKSLKQISFTKNDIKDDGACELAQYVRNTRTLDQIRLFYNDVSSRARQEFYFAMKYREEMGLSYVNYAM